MRVLVISLLRLGDFIQIAPVLSALKTQLNIRELDVLVHDPVAKLKPMMPSVDNWFTIDRNLLQEGLGRADIPLLTSFSILKERLDEVGSRQYQLVINLTQTVFSGWIAGYFSAEQRLGLSFDVRGKAHFHSPWFDYLNVRANGLVSDVFHHTDIFYYGCGLKGLERNWNFRQTRYGQSELASLQLPDGGERIVLQTLTSDEKKNWSKDDWVQMLVQLRMFRPKAEFVALGAPNEAQRIEELVASAKERGIKIYEAILSLEGAFTLLSNSDLLITGDTSIKHLANATETPILELSIGSSDLRRTGAYRANSLILQANVLCAPCPHSSPCSQATHMCSQAISSELVSASAHQMMLGDWSAIRALAQEFKHEARLLRTRVLSTGFWWVEDIVNLTKKEALNTLLERLTQKFHLNRERANQLASFGTESLNLKRELMDIFASPTIDGLDEELEILESASEASCRRAFALLATVKRRTPAIGEIREFLSGHSLESLDWIENWAEDESSEIVPIGGLRKMQNELESCYHQANLKTKLIRSLKSQLREVP